MLFGRQPTGRPTWRLGLTFLRIEATISATVTSRGLPTDRTAKPNGRILRLSRLYLTCRSITRGKLPKVVERLYDSVRCAAVKLLACFWESRWPTSPWRDKESKRVPSIWRYSRFSRVCVATRYLEVQVVRVENINSFSW